MRIVAILAMGALVGLCVLRHDALATAVATVPVDALVVLAGLHLVSLVARSEAWRLSLAAIAGAPPSRAAIHAANAGAFVAGALEPHTAMPARVALLRRLAPGETPHPAHVAVADVPIFLLEVAGASAMLALTGAWWAPLGAAAVLVGARLAAGRRGTRGLAVLTDVRGRLALAGLVGCVVACGVARVWVALAVVHLDASPASAAAAFAALGVFGLLPLGPSAPPGALLVVSGGAGAALGAGLALSATSIAAVLVYAGLLALRGNRAPSALPRTRPASALLRNRSQVRLEPVRVEGAEAVEPRVVGAVEIRRAGRQQAALGAALDDEARADGVVGRVEGLDAVEPQLHEPVDGDQDGVGVRHVPERVCPDGDAAGVVDDLDRLRDRRRGPRAEGRRSWHQIGLEKLRGVHDLLAFEAHPVGWMVKGGLSEVRTADRGPLRQVERKPAGAKRLGHPDRARGAIGTEAFERFTQRRRTVVDPVPEDVQVVPVAIERRQLDRRDEAEAASQARLERLVDAVHRVMVGQREQLHARVGRGRDDRPRR
jgi:hypothetical protein